MEQPKLIRKLERTLSSTGKTWYYKGLFECPYCGNEFITEISFIKTGHTKSCGCQKYIKSCNNLSSTRLHKIWIGIKDRCYNINKKSFNRYGGRGISMCKEWNNNFLSFYYWSIENGYSDNFKIDRINNDGNYEPSNCRWTTDFISQQNTKLLRKTNQSGYRGVSVSGKRWICVICSNGKRHSLGRFSTPEQAAQAYNDWVIAHGTFHPLNIISNGI